MKFIAASAVALATLAGAASAATSAQIDTIQRYAPTANVEALSNAKVAALLTIVHGSGSESDKASTIRSLTR